MSETSSNKTELDKIDILSFVSDCFHRLKRIWWVVILIIAGSMALSYYRVSSNYVPTYVAEATVSVHIVNGGTSADRNTAEQMGKVFPYILTSGALSDVIAADMNMNHVPGTIRVSNISGTNLLTISVTSSDANNAYNVLKSVLKNYPEVAQYVVGQTELLIIDDSGIPADSGNTALIRGSLSKGAVIGLLLSALIVMISAVSMRTIRTESELRSLLNLPCLGTLPFCRVKRRRKTERTEINILKDANRGDYVEAMRLIRTRLERQLEDRKVLMVTSSISGEGKSTVAANLAISMALKGKRVILVDCDLRNPTTGQIFGIEEPLPGLLSLLRGKCSLEETLYEVLDHGEPIGLSVLPGGERETRLVEILGSETMSELIKKLRTKADIVILDTPPSAILVDAMMLMQYVDAVAYVVMSDFARRRYIFNGVEELSVGDAPIIGCILNGGKTRSGTYGYYGSRSRYGYGYYGSGKTSSAESGSGKK